ncbi:MAG: aspartate 1-decarboxylase [Candidatus Omnitrophica bacterium]|nr:aspartate 1-decarboxylase [Candidatus Omnitrophota bacterium]
MFRKMCRAKIHRAFITKKDYGYKGSIGISGALLEASGILPNEMVLVLNYNNGQRFETYVIEEKDAGAIALYGPAAKLGEVGDELIIMSSVYADEQEAKEMRMKIVKVDKDNKVIN